MRNKCLIRNIEYRKNITKKMFVYFIVTNEGCVVIIINIRDYMKFGV